MAEILSEFGHLVGLAGGNNIQATTMPTYSSVPLGTIVQYIGTTTADYINGYFYKATATGWEQHDTQPASNADNSITAFKESSPAQAAHAVDDYIRYNNVTYIVTAAIAIGDTLTIGTNIAVPTLDEGTVIYTPETGGGSAGGGHVIVNPSGTEMAQRASLQFVDANVTDDSSNDKTKIENVKVINSESELANASDGIYMGSYDDEAEGVLSADMIMYDSETTVEEELDNKVDKVVGKGLSTNDYDNTDKAKVGKIDETTTSATGNPISITGLKSNQLAINPIITLEPIQAGSGDPSPSNVRAISSYDKIEVLSTGRNIWGGEKFADDIVAKIHGATKNTTNKTVSFAGVYASNVILFDKFIPNTQYTVMYRTESGYYADMKIVYTDNTIIELSRQGTARYVSDSSKSIKQIEGLFQAEAMIYYDEVGIFVGDVSAEEFEQYNPYQNLQLTLDQTVYGGSLDLRNGKLTVDRGYITADDYTVYSSSTSAGGLHWIEGVDNSNADGTKLSQLICSKYPKAIQQDAGWGSIEPCIDAYSGGTSWLRIYTDAASLESFKSANTDLQVVYYLATPYTIQLTPHEISLLKDYAYVSTNGTNISFSYKNGEMASLGDVAQLGQTVNELGDVVSSIFSKRIPLTQDFVAPANGFASVLIVQNQGQSSATAFNVTEDNTTIIFSGNFSWSGGWHGENVIVPLLKGHTYTFTCDTSPATFLFNDARSYFIY